FVHACGLPPDAPADSLLPPATFSGDLAKEWIAYLSSVIISLGPRLDDVWFAVSSGTVSPSRCLAQPETRVRPDVNLPTPFPVATHSPRDDAGIPFADLMMMMEDPLPTPEPGALQDITAVVGPTAAEAPHFPFIEGVSDPDNLLSVSTSIALNEEKSAPPAPSRPSLDLFVPHEETGMPIGPLSQPSDPVVIGQGVLLPVPDLGETNNNGDDSSVPVPPASNLPTAAKEVEVAIKSSAHALDVENSGMTSPLDDSEPDSSETCMISGPHSESTQPLSGETQQLSITFEAACDVDEVSSRPSPATSGLDRPLRALEVLKDRLATLRREAIGTASQISLVRDQHTCLLSTQRKQSARADLLRMLTLCLDRSVAEDKQHSVALAARLLSLEAEQSRIHAAIAALESEADLLRASDVGA
ncbi:hypothetical protein Taro_012620, partial [Colocasia esculenta]|nr:hypothetical protein [Colocasia esculenta]